MYVKTTFLHNDLEEEIYMKQPEGFTLKWKRDLVYKWKKSLYNLKKSPQMWYQKFGMHIQEFGFVRSWVYHCVYSKTVGDHFIYVVLYVENKLLVGKNMELIKEVESQQSSKLNMKDINAAHFILEMKIKRD